MADLPSPQATFSIPEKGPNIDFLHFKNSAGDVVGWVDSDGAIHGLTPLITPIFVLTDIDGGTF